MLAAAKIGATVAEFDADVKTVPEIRAALAAAKGRVISFNINKNDANDKITLLRKAIPEFYHCKLLLSNRLVCFDGPLD